MTNNHPDQIDIDIDEILKTFVYLAVHGYGVSEDRKPYVDAVKMLVLEERLSELTTLEDNSDCLEDGCGLDAELLRDNLLRRIKNLEGEIEKLK